MENTILSEKDTQLIEKTIVKYGRMVNITDLMSIFQEQYSSASAHNRIQILSRNGWLRRLKRGLYLIIDSLTSRSQIDVSLLRIANTFIEDSYVSGAHALNYYQLFDQYSSTVLSITIEDGKKYLVDGYIFKYSKVKKTLYFGFTEKIIDGKKIRIAEVEKVLIDYFYLDKSFQSASLVFEKLQEHHHELDLLKLQQYAKRCGLTMARKIGFLLDELKLDAGLLHGFVKKNRGFSRFTADSKIFNAKWRLYYDDRIIG